MNACIRKVVRLTLFFCCSVGVCSMSQKVEISRWQLSHDFAFLGHFLWLHVCHRPGW